MELDQEEYKKLRRVHPFFVFGTLILLNLGLASIFFTFPKNGIQLAENFNLKFYNYSLFVGDTIQEKSINVLTDVLKDVDITVSKNKHDKDSVVIKNKSGLVHSLNAQVAVSTDTNNQKIPLIQGLKHIQLPPNNPQVFKSLKTALNDEILSRLIRILHYGDSQLEGDRITDYLRQKLQESFAGGGTGMLLPKEPTAGARKTAFVSQSPNIFKKAIYLKAGQPKENRYGLGAAAFEIKGNLAKCLRQEVKTIASEDSVEKEEIQWIYDKNAQDQVFIKISIGKNAFPLVKNFQKVSLFFYATETFKVKVKSGDYEVIEDVNPEKYNTIKSWKIPPSSDVKITFLQGAPSLLLGVSLDSDNGITVDNFAMRGSSALGFSSINKAFYNQQLQAAGVKLIVLQYGINVVPNVVSDYTYYKKMLSKELAAIRAANANVGVLIIGPSDMSRKTQNGYSSYPNIPKIRDAMRAAAFENGCAFWDLYEVMGGQNSMNSWVAEGLAQKDFTHFSHKGAQYIGELLYTAIMEAIRNNGVAVIGNQLKGF